MGFTESYQVAPETGAVLTGDYDITGASSVGLLWVYGPQTSRSEVQVESECS
jgi:hypothetical protein